MSHCDCSGRVAPEEEGLQPGADRVLDKAAARPEVQEVVPPDRGGITSIGRSRTVSVVGVYCSTSATSVDDLPRGQREVATDLDAPGSPRRHAAVVAQVGQVVTEPAHKVREQHETEWAAMRAVSESLGVGTTETVRNGFARPKSMPAASGSIDRGVAGLRG